MKPIGGARTELFIRDDYGYSWTLDGNRIKLAGETEKGSGLLCYGWEDAVRVLNENGYITSDLITKDVKEKK